MYRNLGLDDLVLFRPTKAQKYPSKEEFNYFVTLFCERQKELKELYSLEISNILSGFPEKNFANFSSYNKARVHTCIISFFSESALLSRQFLTILNNFKNSKTESLVLCSHKKALEYRLKMEQNFSREFPFEFPR